MKNVVLLGCTGSIGDSSFKVLENLGDKYRLIGISGGRQVDKLIRRARQWKVPRVCLGDSDQLDQVRQALPTVEISCGPEGLAAMAQLEEADIVINGLVGAVGLGPSLAAAKAGKMLAMANKEPLVMAGELVLAQVEAGGGVLLPLDSEPNAIWQCLQGESPRHIRRLLLTASGGPFFGRTTQQMQAVSPAQALDHPTWKMGAKITVDSATLMNKGFEIIEASYLFGIPEAAIEVVIHRQSVVHSMVEFNDASILAHLGKTDMMLPIQYALTHPERSPTGLEYLDFSSLGQLTFAAPDGATFPALDLCRMARRAGGTVPAALNAANEVAVQAFLEKRIGFLDIVAICQSLLDQWDQGPAETLEQVLAADAEGRRQTVEFIPPV
ncbi:MAG: 1-deoxy-D-xylulose-5-phosphate reductoisomerase [Candidatus Latescibacteria bacterium]|nr:1-deoxy-D-xylulose-5-phosphate reductoisomerase [Candidatus Latescibacterota bacterium]